MLSVNLVGKVYEYAAELSSVEKIAAEADEILKDPSYVFQCIVVDGTAVFENHYEYLKENIDKIKSVEFIISTVDQLIEDTIYSMVEYIERAVPEIRVIADSFYLGGEDNEVINKLGQLIEGLIWIISALGNIENFKDRSELLSNDYYCAELSLNAGKLKDGYNGLRDALFNMDMVLIGDLMNYEILDILDTLDRTLKNMLGTDRNDPN